MEARSVGVHWVIVGGESGPGARPCDVSWIRSIVEQCKTAEVPCFVKQLGADPRPLLMTASPLYAKASRESAPQQLWGPLLSRKGADPSEWPADLRVQEFPT
jgi:hypothetical protein